MSTHAENKELYRLIEQIGDTPGWRVEDTKRSWMVYPPEGPPIAVPQGPRSPYRALRNYRAMFRRAGLEC